MNSANTVIERTIGLVGGVLVTKRTTGDVYSYPNIHGDIVATADGTGARIGTTMSYDPFGQALTALADNQDGTMDYAWLGRHQRPLEHQTGLNTIEMGARQYVPSLGRFLEVDPVEAGTSNDYAYVDDPINDFDLQGTWGFKKFFKRAIKNRFARMAVAGLGAAALCAGTGGLGCMILAGGAVGAGLGAGNAALNGGSLLGGAGTGAVEGAIAGLIVGSGQGKELKFSRNFRIAPGGNRGPGRFQRPHYHRRYPGDGGSINRHRPWQGW